MGNIEHGCDDAEGPFECSNKRRYLGVSAVGGAVSDGAAVTVALVRSAVGSHLARLAGMARYCVALSRGTAAVTIGSLCGMPSVYTS